MSGSAIRDVLSVPDNILEWMYNRFDIVVGSQGIYNRYSLVEGLDFTIVFMSEDIRINGVNYSNLGFSISLQWKIAFSAVHTPSNSISPLISSSGRFENSSISSIPMRPSTSSTTIVNDEFEDKDDDILPYRLIKED